MAFDTDAWLEYDADLANSSHQKGFARIGEDVTIREWTRFARPENIAIGNHVIIDDFVLVSGGRGDELTIIGNYVHISCFTSILGSGGITMGDFSGLSPGCRLFSETDDYTDGGLMNPTVPVEFRTPAIGRIVLGEFAEMGANTVVLPDVTIGEGAVTGAGSLVIRDLAPWTVNVGTPTRVLKMRNRDEVLRRAAELEATR